jgi:nucleotide-binding universal stress UspA family protein
VFEQRLAENQSQKEMSMDSIRKILVPTDFSPHADEAFRVAHMLARTTGAEVVVFHVAQPPAVVTEAGTLLAGPGSKPANLWERFQHFRSTAPEVRVQHQVIVADKAGASHILDILDRLECDLIVMGTHGNSWLTHLLFGSVTEEVVRKARCPVMVVKAPAHAVPVSAPAAAKPAVAPQPAKVEAGPRGKK